MRGPVPGQLYRTVYEGRRSITYNTWDARGNCVGKVPIVIGEHLLALAVVRMDLERLKQPNSPDPSYFIVLVLTREGGPAWLCNVDLKKVR